MSTIVGDTGCPKCMEAGGDVTKNHLILFEDGGGYCNRCGYTQKPEGEENMAISLEEIATFKTREEYRGIKQIVAEAFGVKMSVNGLGDMDASFYPVKKKGKIVGYKQRIHPKKFYAVGDIKGDTELFGVKGSNNKRVLITGGEEDALSAFQMLKVYKKQYDYSVYSVVHGEQAVADIKNNFEMLNAYEEVIFAFDSDGKHQAGEMASLFGNKGKLMVYSEKDCNDLLKTGKQQEFISSYFSAKAYAPEGIVNGADLWEDVKTPISKASVKYPWAGLNKMTYGIRTPEVVTIAAGSGQGKSVFTKELIYNILLTTDEHVGVLSLEESVKRCAVGLMSVHAEKPLHLLEADESLLKDAFDATLGKGKVFFYDNFGSNSIGTILEMIRYLVVADGCKYVVLDHISIVVSSQENADERKALDEIMTKLRMLVQELDICLFLVSHLRRPVGKGHENGAVVEMSQLRGTAAIAQLSDMVIGLERDGQHDDEDIRNTTNVRIVKSRYVGYTGVACSLKYDKVTGRMKEVENVFA
ncbi:MAG: hypothetical protein GQ474_07980 [Sulfurimonas sp.]|nr:hypothetical protein [Sulfurimonas sp.]